MFSVPIEPIHISNEGHYISDREPFLGHPRRLFRILTKPPPAWHCMGCTWTTARLLMFITGMMLLLYVLIAAIVVLTLENI